MLDRPRTHRSAKARRSPQLESLESRALLSFASSDLAAQSNQSFDSLIRAAETRINFEVDGSGLAAAVIDTGVDYRSPVLGSGFGAGHTVSGGYDLAMGDSDPFAETWSHGTNVSGLIVSQSKEAPGVATGANLIALRVFGNDNFGDFETIADGLQWVIDHHDEYHITVVNLSVSDGGNRPRDWYSRDNSIGQRMAGLIDQLTALRIPVVAAAGNSYNGSEGMGFVAILPGTVSVTASTRNDQLMSNAQRLGSSVGEASATDLAAPGDDLLTAGESGGLTRVGGTSFAAPLVTGSIVLLQQIYQRRFGTLPAVSDVVDWLKRGSDSILDSASGFVIGRLNVARSAALIPTPPVVVDDDPAPPVPIPDTPTPTPPVTPDPTPVTPAPSRPQEPPLPTPNRVVTIGSTGEQIEALRKWLDATFATRRLRVRQPRATVRLRRRAT